MTPKTNRSSPTGAKADTTVENDANVTVPEPSPDRSKLATRRQEWLKWIVPAHTSAGIFLAIAILHPLTMVIYCLEFHPELAQTNTFRWVASRMGSAFSFEMWPMTVAFALIGALLGLGSGLYSRAITQKLLLVSQLDRKLGTTAQLLINAGESDTVEFKSSLRWDHRQQKCNKALEMVITKTVAGFLNHQGGDLLIGVADDGSIVGVEDDYATLRKKDRDGFELFLNQLLRKALGADVCTLLHTIFQAIEGHDICRVLIEPANRPVYVQHQGRAQYFLRTGNSTHELDTREALEHITRRES